MKILVNLIGAFALMAPFAVFSQSDAPACSGSDSWESCVENLVNQYDGKYVKSQATNQAEAKVENNVVTRNTGESDSASGLTTTVTEDFLSKAAVSVASNGNSNSADGQAYVFEITDFLGLDSEDGYKAEIRLNEGGLYAPLDMLLRNSNLAAQADRLGEEIGDFDNVSVGLSYSPTGSFFGHGRWGRNPEIYNELTESLVKKATIHLQSEDELSLKANIALGKFAQGKFDEGDDIKPLNQVFPDEIERAVFIETAAKAVKSNQEYYAAFTTALDTAQIFQLSSLIDNQPQLYLSLNGTINDELAGPDEVSLKFTYEYGMYNVNRLLRQCSADDDSFAACFRSYVVENSKAIQSGNRMALSLEYQRTQRYSFTQPDENISLEEDRSKSMILGLSWGRYIDNTNDGNTRVELQAAYEDVSGDTDRQGRGIATATFSHALSQGVYTSVSLVYANKPEYRGDVDNELSARLGLNYKLGSVTQPNVN